MTEIEGVPLKILNAALEKAPCEWAYPYGEMRLAIYKAGYKRGAGARFAATHLAYCIRPSGEKKWRIGYVVGAQANETEAIRNLKCHFRDWLVGKGCFIGINEHVTGIHTCGYPKVKMADYHNPNELLALCEAVIEIGEDDE